MTNLLLVLLALASPRGTTSADLALESVYLADQPRVQIVVANRGPGRLKSPGGNAQFTLVRPDGTTLSDFRDFSLAALAAGEMATVDLDFSDLLVDQPAPAGRRVAVRVWAENDRNPANNSMLVEDGAAAEGTSRGLFCRQTGLDPFAHTITLRYGLPCDGLARIEVLDQDGQHLATVASERKTAGVYEVVWDGRSGAREPVATGVYVCRLLLAHDSRSDTTTEKIVFVR